MYKVIVKEIARDDLRSAVRYIANELKNPSAANRLADEFEKHVLELTEMPERYQLLQDRFLALNQIRAFSVGNYLAFYTVHPETQTVAILRFLYGKRNWMRIIEARSKEELGEH